MFEYKLHKFEPGTTLDELIDLLNSDSDLNSWECIQVIKKHDGYYGTIYECILKRGRNDATLD